MIRQGIAEPDQVPLNFGVLVAQQTGELITARQAPRLHQTLPFGTWMALARAAPRVFEREPDDELLDTETVGAPSRED